MLVGLLSLLFVFFTKYLPSKISTRCSKNLKLIPSNNKKLILTLRPKGAHSQKSDGLIGHLTTMYFECDTSTGELTMKESMINCNCQVEIFGNHVEDHSIYAKGCSRFAIENLLRTEISLSTCSIKPDAVQNKIEHILCQYGIWEAIAWRDSYIKIHHNTYNFYTTNHLLFMYSEFLSSNN